MVDRILILKSYKDHPWFNRLYKRLSKSDLEICISFLDQNRTLSKGDLELKINRLFLDKDKPKNHLIIQEILQGVNSAS